MSHLDEYVRLPELETYIGDLIRDGLLVPDDVSDLRSLHVSLTTLVESAEKALRGKTEVAW